MFLLMVFDDSCDDTGQVAMRLYFVQLTGLDERREYGPVLGTCIVAREECVFALQRDWADRPFDGVWTCPALVPPPVLV